MVGAFSLAGEPVHIGTFITRPLRLTMLFMIGDFGGISITFGPGKKGVSGYGSPWDRDVLGDVEAIRALGASFVLTLIEPHESDLLEVRGLPDAVREAGMVCCTLRSLTCLFQGWRSMHRGGR